MEAIGQLNIGILINRFPPDWIGGAELQAQQLAHVFAQRGHDVTVFTRRYENRPVLELQDGYSIRRRRMFPIPMARMILDAIPFLNDIVRHRPRPDVLVCYQTLNCGFLGVIAQSVLGIPAVLSVRGDNEYRLNDSVANRWLVPAIYRRVRRLIVQSPRMVEDLHEQFATAGKRALNEQLASKISVIRNGIHLNGAHRSNGKTILYVGRLITNKGVADLLAAVQQIPDAKVVIVGDGPDRRRLEALATGLPVTFMGRVAPTEVEKHLQDARLLVLPSSLGDGTPNAILEAMACGVPVVTTGTAGMPDLIRHGETGFLVEPGDISDLRHYIDRLLHDDALCKRIGESSMKEVKAYSWDAVAPQFEQLLRGVAGKN